jgi:hypothetical protein
VTFQQLVILADQDGVVDITPQAIASRTGIPIEIIVRGLTDLEQPDPASRTPDEEGRRITRISDHRDWGWHIVNYHHYRHLRSGEDRRDYHRTYQRSRRNQPPNSVSTPVNSLSTVVNRSQPQITEAEAEAEAVTNTSYSKAFLIFWSTYPKRPGQSKAGAWRAWKARLAEGEDPYRMLHGAEAYAAYVKRERTEPKYVKHAATFLGPDKHYLNDFGPPADPEPEAGLTFVDEIPAHAR